LVVELLGDVLANEFVVIGVGFDFARKNGVFDGFEFGEAFDAAVIFAFMALSLSFSGVGLLLCGCFVGEGFWLFRRMNAEF